MSVCGKRAFPPRARQPADAGEIRLIRCGLRSLVDVNIAILKKTDTGGDCFVRVRSCTSLCCIFSRMNGRLAVRITEIQTTSE